jgi:hypothetical protein
LPDSTLGKKNEICKPVSRWKKRSKSCKV